MPDSAISMQSPYKMLHGADPDLGLLQLISTKALYTSSYTPKSSNSMQLKETQWSTATTTRATASTVQPLGASRRIETSPSSRHRCAYSHHRRINPGCRCMGMDSLVITNTTATSQKMAFLSDIRNYTLIAEFFPDASADDIIAGGR